MVMTKMVQIRLFLETLFAFIVLVITRLGSILILGQEAMPMEDNALYVLVVSVILETLWAFSVSKLAGQVITSHLHMRKHPIEGVFFIRINTISILLLNSLYSSNFLTINSLSTYPLCAVSITSIKDLPNL